MTNVHPIVAEKREALEALCRKHRVKRLELFGSVVSGAFDPATSDLDFLYEFERLPPGEYADAFFGLLTDLKSLFGRDIDLVSPTAIQNKYFLAAVNRSRVLLYAA